MKLAFVGFGRHLWTRSSVSHCDQSTSTAIDKKETLFVRELQDTLGANGVETGLEERKIRAKPWSSYHSNGRVPSAIVFPQSTQDVVSIMRVCSKHAVPLVAFGGGTSLEGHTIATHDPSLSVDFNQMNKIIEFHEKDLDVVVQPGLGYIELNDFLRPYGLWFPLDPGPGASVGGMCACRCSGSTALKYGSMRDNVLNVTAVLADGTVMKTGSRARKSSAGYDLTRLLVGSEGTLGIITEVTLKLHPIPRHSYVLKTCFPSVVEASLAATKALQSGISLGRAELMDEVMVAILNHENPTMVPWQEKVTVLFEVTGSSEASTTEQLNELTTICHTVNNNSNNSSSNSINNNSTKDQVIDSLSLEGKALWRLRKECLWSAISRYPDREAMITDACVPLSQLPRLVHATREAIASTTLPCPIVAHAGDGNVHVLIMFRPTVEEDVAAAKLLSTTISHLAIQLGGTCTGVGKREQLCLEMGEGSMTVMARIKQTLDPQHLLNPDKVISQQQLQQLLSLDHNNNNNNCVCKAGCCCEKKQQQQQWKGKSECL